jgi:hypothetical protein
VFALVGELFDESLHTSRSPVRTSREVSKMPALTPQKSQRPSCKGWSFSYSLRLPRADVWPLGVLCRGMGGYAAAYRGEGSVFS